MKRRSDNTWCCSQTTDENDTPLGDDLLTLAIDLTNEHSSTLVFSANSNDIIPLNAQEEQSIDAPPTLYELIGKQALEIYCESASLSVGHAGSEFHIGQRGILVRKSIVDESILIVALSSLRARNLYLAHHPPIAGHQRQRCMYNKLRRTYY